LVFVKDWISGEQFTRWAQMHCQLITKR
jgi:hypothetical protein